MHIRLLSCVCVEGGTYVIHVGEKRNVGNLKEEDHSENIGLEDRII